jgi:hypothetical protein
MLGIYLQKKEKRDKRANYPPNEANNRPVGPVVGALIWAKAIKLVISAVFLVAFKRSLKGLIW